MLSTKTHERLVAFIHVEAFLIPVRRLSFTIDSRPSRSHNSIRFSILEFFFQFLLSCYWKSVHDNRDYTELLYYMETITNTEQTVNVTVLVSRSFASYLPSSP